VTGELDAGYRIGLQGSGEAVGNVPGAANVGWTAMRRRVAEREKLKPANLAKGCANAKGRGAG
jgi:hypothetical protein